MVEKDTIYESKIKHTGTTDFKELYQFLYTWLTDEGYDVYEKKYSEKVAGDVKEEIKIEWEAKKKISDYFRNVIKSKWRIVNMKDVEVQQGNRKIKMQKGIFEIKFEGILQKDYENKWEKTPIMKFLRGLYDKYVIQTRIEHYEEKLFSKTNDIVEQAKAFLTITGTR